MAIGLRVPHYDCEDCWYSCPKSAEGCCDDAAGSDCNCGAEKYNAYIEALEVDRDAWRAHAAELKAQLTEQHDEEPS